MSGLRSANFAKCARDDMGYKVLYSVGFSYDRASSVNGSLTTARTFFVGEVKWGIPLYKLKSLARGFVEV